MIKESTETPTAPLYVARQPVFDRNLSAWACSLRFWETGLMKNEDPGGSLRLLVDVVSLALPGTEAGRKLIVQLSPALLGYEFEQVLPADRLIIDLGSAITADERTVKACKRLKSAGLTLMAGDTVRRPEYRALLPYLDIVHYELPRPTDHLNAPIEGFRGQRMVSRVEDREILTSILKLGFANFALFQGAFFSKPRIVSGRRPSTADVGKLRLMAELSRSDFSPARLASILQADATLTLRLFNHVNSAELAVRRKVASIQHAITVLGETRTRSFLRVMLLTELSSGATSDELVLLSVQRGRFLELVSATLPKPPLAPDSMFLVGLFSLLDAMMGIPLNDLVSNLPIDDPVKRMLLTPSNPWLLMLTAQERARWDELERLQGLTGLDPRRTALLYLQASEWAVGVLSSR